MVFNQEQAYLQFFFFFNFIINIYRNNIWRILINICFINSFLSVKIFGGPPRCREEQRLPSKSSSGVSTSGISRRWPRPPLKSHWPPLLPPPGNFFRRKQFFINVILKTLVMNFIRQEGNSKGNTKLEFKNCQVSLTLFSLSHIRKSFLSFFVYAR